MSALTPATAARAVRFLSWAALAALGLAAAVVALAVVAIRSEWVSWRFGVDGLLSGLAPALAALAIALGLAVAAVRVLAPSPRPGPGPSLVVISVAALGLLGWSTLRSQATRRALINPPVHDVATDWRDPLMPTPALVRLRGPRAFPIAAAPAVPEGPRTAFLGRLVAEVNTRTCPGATPLDVASAPGAAFTRLGEAVRREGWTVFTDAPGEGRTEATRADGLLAARSDLLARVRPEGAGARVDLRVVGRSEPNDGGAACRRVSELRAALAARP